MPNPYAPPVAEPPEEREPVEHPVAEQPVPPPPIRDGQQFVNVYSTHDLVQAEMIDQMLRAEGIPTPGFSKVSGAQVGAGWMALNHVIRVPAEREAEALALIEAFQEAGPQEAEEDPEEDLSKDVQTRSQRLKTFYWRLLLVAVALWFAMWLFTLLPKEP